MGEKNTYNVCHNGQESPMGYTTNTCASCIHVFISEVDYMMANISMYVVATLNYKKVTRIILEAYRVAIIVEH